MRYLAIILVACACHGQTSSSRYLVIPRSDGSETGIIRAFSLDSAHQVDVLAPQVIQTNKALRWPADNGIILATENHRFAGAMTVDIFRANGTAAAPVAVVDGDLLHEFNTHLYDGAAYVPATSIRSEIYAIGPVFNSALALYTRDTAGTYGRRAVLSSDGHWTPAGSGSQDLGAASLRWRKLWVTECDGCGTGAGSAPLGEVKITDYGVSNTTDYAGACTAPLTQVALNSAKDALPLDATGGFHAGIITFPAGKYCTTALEITVARDLGYGDITLRGAGPGNEYAAIGAATEIRYMGADPGTPKPMLEHRYTLGGGIGGMQLNANGVANTRILRIKQARYARYPDITGRRWTNGPGLEFAADSTSYGPSGHSAFYDLYLVDVRDGDNASGILFDGALDRGPASINFFGGRAMFSRNGTGVYGIKLKQADNNIIDLQVWSSACSAFPCEANPTDRESANPGILLEQGTNPGFPGDNRFTGTIITGYGHTIEGVSGISGNLFNFTPSDCGGLVVECFPMIRNVSGQTPFGFYGASAARFPHPDIGYASWSLDQTNGTAPLGTLGQAGVLAMQYQGRTRARISADVTNGMQFWSAAGACGLLASVGVRSVQAAAGMSLTSITVSGVTATANLTAAHDCTTGHNVRVTGSPVAALNGEYAITATGSATISWTTTAPAATYNNGDLTVEVAPRQLWYLGGSGIWRPVVNGVGAIGISTAMPAEIYSQSYKSYTSSGFGVQSHTLTADNSINFAADCYTSAANRCAFLLDKGNGTSGFPSPVVSNDLIGTFGWRVHLSGGLAGVAAIRAYVDSTVSSGFASSNMRFATMSAAGALTERWRIQPDGVFAPEADGTTDIGSPAKRVQSLYVGTSIWLNGPTLAVSTVPGTAAISIDTEFFPTVTAGPHAFLGLSTRRWNFLYSNNADINGTATVANLTVTGACTGCGSTSLPVVDTTAIVKGSADPTKLVRFEVDGLTTATTRVLTVPNQDITLAGLERVQTWTASQTLAPGNVWIIDRTTRTATSQMQFTVNGNVGVLGGWTIGTQSDGAGGSQISFAHNVATQVAIAEDGTIKLVSATAGIYGPVSGLVDVAGVTGETFVKSNGTYRVGLNTIVDASRNATFANINPASSNAFDVGGAALRWRKYYGVDADISGLATVANLTVTGACLGCSSTSPLNIYTNSSVAPQNNFITGDSNVNLYLQAYSSGTASDRSAIIFRRARGSLAFPAALQNGDRMGVFAAQEGFGGATTARINFVADSSGVSGSVVPTSIAFATLNPANSLADRWTITSNGNLMPGANSAYVIGSSATMVNEVFSQYMQLGTNTAVGGASNVRGFLYMMNDVNSGLAYMLGDSRTGSGDISVIAGGFYPAVDNSMDLGLQLFSWRRVYSRQMTVTDGFTIANWTNGTGAPSGGCATGSMYTNTSGGAGTTLYVCQSGAWVGK